MGSAQSARGIQLGGSGFRRHGVGGSPQRDLSPASAGPRRAHFLRGGAPRPALGRPGSARGEGGSPAPAASFTATPRISPRRFPGVVESVLTAPSLPAGRDGAPSLPARLSTGGGLSSVRPDRVAPLRAGIGSRITGARGQRRCRLPTRPVLKHGPRSLTRARVRGSSTKPRGAMKVRAGARRLRWDPGPLRGSPAHHRPVSPAPSGRWSLSACDRTRKMVNYAWAGRSQRKLWWRSAAVLTCKSVVRPGYRGERLIEPSSSWFPPKFPSG